MSTRCTALLIVLHCMPSTLWPRRTGGAGAIPRSSESASEGTRSTSPSWLGRQSHRGRLGDATDAPGRRNPYSHSIVPGGFDVMSSVTRFTCAISLIMREATRSSRS